MPPTMLMDIRRNKNLTRGEVARALGCSIPWLSTIERHPRALAPNSPVIPKLAEILGLTEPEVQAFAKAEPMNEAQIKLSRFRMGRTMNQRKPGDAKALLGTGDAEQPPPKTKAAVRAPTSLRAAREARGLSGPQLATKLGVHASFVARQVDFNDIAPNHPLVPKIAKALGMSKSAVKKLAKRPLMDELALQKSATRLGKPVPGLTPGPRGTSWKKKSERLTWATRKRLQREAARAKAKEPGTALATVPKHTPPTKKPKADGETPMKRAYNALRLMDPTTRQCARSLAMATTLAAMKGARFLDVAVPTEGMAAILNDWLKLKGIPEVVVLAVDYEKVFG